MLHKKHNFLLLLAFLIAYGGILILQYKSYTKTQTLIQSNKDLLEEMDYTNNVQFFQTHLSLYDNNLQAVVIQKDEQSINDLKREIKILSLSLNYINTYLSTQNRDFEIDEFNQTMKSKLEIGNELISDLERKKTISPELISRGNQMEELNLIINNKLIEIEDISEQIIIDKTESINKNEEQSIKNNLYFTIISTLLFGLALYFIFSRIKKQNQLIDALQISKEKEIKLNKIKENFLANMSHEIRTPLNAIMGFTAILEKESISDKAKEITATIKNAGTQLVTIVNQILDLSKIEEGKIRIEQQPFILNSVLSKIEDSFRIMIESKGLKFIIQREFDPSLELIGDEYRLIQILTNLIGNANKFTEKGEIRFTIKEEKLDANTTTIQFNISDTGIGIEENKLETIFERFEQADNDTTRKYGGSGLGLAIVQQLVGLLKGSINVKSQLNKGSEFIVSIPFVISQIDNRKPTMDESDQFKPIDITAKILIVEDNPINIKLIQHWFDHKNINLTTVTSGSEAIEILEKNEFDIIYMDIQMPEMDGIECTKIIRNKLGIITPIIAMTAHTMKHEILQCYDAGMNAHISKPLDENQFFGMMGYFQSIDNSGLVSLPYLQDLSKGDTNFIKDLLTEFLVQTPLEIEKLTKAFYSENLLEIKTIAHTLKTNFSYLGADSNLLSLIQIVEDWTEIPSHYNHLYLIKYLFEKSKIKVNLLLAEL